MDYRMEKDTFGEIKVPANKLGQLRHSGALRIFGLASSKCRSW